MVYVITFEYFLGFTYVHIIFMYLYIKGREDKLYDFIRLDSLFKEDMYKPIIIDS